MRRGLMAWDADEVPASALAERLARLRGAMRRHGLDALILYTSFPRPSAVSYVTAFTPYWADALLLVPKDGEPVFATALSKRVANWIQSVKPVAELVNTPQPGAIIGQRLAADPSAKTVGILELDALPNALYGDLAAAASNVRFVEGAPAFRAARSTIDAAERGLLARTDAIASAALQSVDATAMRVAGAAVGAVEKAARLAGAEEAYIHIAPDLAAGTRFVRLSGSAPLGRRFAVRASVAYKSNWVRRVRTFVADAERERWLVDTLAALKPEQPIGAQLATRLPAGATLESFLAESSIGSYPLEAIASPGNDAAVPAGSLVVLSVRITLDGAPWLGGAPVIVNAGRSEL
jgi:hypothetical protein